MEEGPMTSCKHPRLNLVYHRRAAVCFDCGKTYPYDIDMAECGYKPLGLGVYVREDLTSTDINSELTSIDTKPKRRIVSLCPFHEENTPSFFIDAKENRYKCLSCGIEGKVTELCNDLARL